MDNVAEILAAINNVEEEKEKKKRDLTVLCHFVLLIAVIGIVTAITMAPSVVLSACVVGYIILAELIVVHLIRMKEK